MDKRLLAITAALFASVTLCFGAGSPYITWFKGGGTNNFLTNLVIKTPLFELNTNLTSLTPTIFLDGTNTYDNPLGKHIALVQGSAIATSSDGAFSPFGPFQGTGVNIEFVAGNEQIAIVEVIDANTAIVGEGTGNALVHPNINIASTTAWKMRSNPLGTSDNTVGARNNGLRIDGNGGVWQWSGNMQGAYYFAGLNGIPTMSLGMISAGTVGLQGQETYGFNVSSFRTNAADYPAAKAPQLYISPGAGSETIVASAGASSGTITEVALQGPIVNRHGTRLAIVPNIIASNGVASQLSNKLPLVVIGTSIAATNGGFNWTNTTGGNVYVFVDNAGVTASAFKINGTTIYTSALGDFSAPLQDQEWISMLYTVGTPTMKYKPF